jgi:hypothetical protein
MPFRFGNDPITHLFGSFQVLGFGGIFVSQTRPISNPWTLDLITLSSLLAGHRHPVLVLTRFTHFPRSGQVNTHHDFVESGLNTISNRSHRGQLNYPWNVFATGSEHMVFEVFHRTTQ